MGNGAFVLKEWKQSQVVRVTKSDTYWDRERVRLREVAFYPMENPAVGDAAFRAGQIHTTKVPVDRFAAYKKDPRMAPLQHESASLATAFLRLNCSRAPLDDVRVRRALSLARGEAAVFVQRPVSAALLAVAAVVLVLAIVPSLRKKRDEVFVE